MENKKQQYFSRNGNSKSTPSASDFNRQKSSSSSSAELKPNKQWPRNSRRRENPFTTGRNSYNNNSNNKLYQSTKVRPNVDKRPRPRGYYNNNNNSENASYRSTNNDNIITSTGLDNEDSLPDDSLLGAVGLNNHELNTTKKSGNQRTNLQHLLNFYCTPRIQEYTNDVPRIEYTRKPKYNKEQFLQANFQFVIKATAKRKTDVSPDALIDWPLIEQINMQTPEETQCPICLYPPVAAKITRCGHVYCWPCILHYLSLSDKTWRKCPICYESIHLGDLKSAAIMPQQMYNVGSNITFQLMRRKKGSFFIEKHSGVIMNDDKHKEKYPFLSCTDERKLFSKFLLANRSDVASILAREEHELLSNADESCPENVFIQQALILLKERNMEISAENKNAKIHETIDHDNSVERQNDAMKCDENSSSDVTTSSIEVEIEEEEEEERKNNLESNGKNTEAGSTKYYYFYQSDDAQNIYLHPLNVKMLQYAYGSLAMAPQNLSGRILQKEYHSMDEEHRRKFTCLGHLPLTCQFTVVEIELLSPYVTEDVLNKFRPDILFRKQERNRRERAEREHARKIDAINDRQMGKLVASTANLNLNSVQEFPMCGFEEPLVPPISDNMEVPNNSLSPVRRNKTLSNSSTGSCTYSSIASHCQREQTPKVTQNFVNINSNTNRKKSDNDNNDGAIGFHNLYTNLGDVLAQALSQTNEKKKSSNDNNVASNGSSKKSKKSKKMLPLYSTGINYNGN